MILYYLDLFGVVVFAISGALAAGRKSLDWLGVVVIALVTAIGGGTLRDMLLGKQVFWLTTPFVVEIIILSALLTIVWTRFFSPPRKALQIADALGLATFGILGAQVAEAAGMNYLVAIILGTMTGTAGGMLRDVILGDIPMILRPDRIYATPVIIGIGAYIFLHNYAGVGETLAIVVGMALIAGLRIGAVVWDWRLPAFKFRDKM